MPLFYPYRALGYITDETPFSIVKRSGDYTVTVSVGKAWQIYNCSKLQLQFIGPELEKRICAIAGKYSLTFAAYGRKIGVFTRGTQVATWTGHTGRVLQMLVLGKYLLSLGEDHRILIWRTGRGGGLESEIQLDDSFTPTCMIHPETYLNKILVCSDEGRLQLWNIISKKMIYEFKGWGSPVRCCVSSPALDVVGVGCADGHIHVFNLKYDETLMTLAHTTKGPVTALSFRTDGQPVLAAGGTSGEITIWNLEKRKLQAVTRNAHDDTICSLYFFPKEPVLISSAADNSLKMWIFDSDDGEARLLRFRSGHSAPPMCIQYYGQGRRILSAGQDRSFRLFSTLQDHQSKELSQGHLASKAKRYAVKEEELRLPRVLGFAASDIRERDWCNVVTCHEGDSAAYTWRLQNFVIGEHVLRAPGVKQSPVTAVAISACGNFAVIGNAAGRIHRFNLQSGHHRGVIAMQSSSSRDNGAAHEKAVTGLECSSCNKLLISSGLEGTLKVWNFRKWTFQAAMDVGSPVTKLKFHSGNGLAVAVCDDQVLRLYDVDNVRLVRKFEGHSDRITDVSFSADGRWLLSSSMDSTLRIFDVVASRPLDTMRVDVPITALSLSPSMDLLATTHVNRNGIYLWANQLLYSGLQAAELQGSGAAKVTDVACLPALSMGLPLSKSEEEEEEDGEEEKDAGKMEDDAAEQGKDEGRAENEDKKNESPTGEGGISCKHAMLSQQLDPELVTLALLPKAQWKGLVDIDIIKQRNKPAAPSKKPEQAPFFLPTLPSFSGEPFFALPPMENKVEADNKALSRVRKSMSVDEAKYMSAFTQLLHKGADLQNYAELTALLRTLSPSAIDVEVRMMMVVDDEDVSDTDSERLRDIGMVLDFLVHETEANSSFELIQAFMQLFLKVHGEAIAARPELKAKARALLDKQRLAWQRVDSLFQNLRCSISFLTNSQQ